MANGVLLPSKTIFIIDLNSPSESYDLGPDSVEESLSMIL